jgi:hypothetical protein
VSNWQSMNARNCCRQRNRRRTCCCWPSSACCAACCAELHASLLLLLLLLCHLVVVVVAGRRTAALALWQQRGASLVPPLRPAGCAAPRRGSPTQWACWPPMTLLCCGRFMAVAASLWVMM